MNGFLVINKKAGISSFDVIRRLKKINKFKKIGYIGTLDRNATGVLPVAINEGVKLIPLLEDYEKSYKAKFLLGVKTDTFDIEGKVLEKKEADEFKREELERILKGFEGEITQKVPIFSSKKINRKPLYKLARKGINIEVPEKKVHIYSIKLIDYIHPYVDVEITCSKGTYIRSLANDFGEILGTGATLYGLVRTRHGDFTYDMSVSLDEIKERADMERHIIPVEDVLPGMNKVIIDIQFERFLRQGMPVPIMSDMNAPRQDEMVKLLNRSGKLIAIGMTDTKTNTIKVKRLINN